MPLRREIGALAQLPRLSRRLRDFYSRLMMSYRRSRALVTLQSYRSHRHRHAGFLLPCHYTAMPAAPGADGSADLPAGAT